MNAPAPHRRHERRAVAVAVRAGGMWVVTAILFATFVNSEHATKHPLATGSWLTAVALSGIFCAAWVARDTATHGPRSLRTIWGAALILVVLALTVAALLTDTERSRTSGTDPISALGTSALIGAGLAFFALIGLLCGRAVAASTGRPPVQD